VGARPAVTTTPTRSLGHDYTSASTRTWRAKRLAKLGLWMPGTRTVGVNVESPARRPNPAFATASARQRHGLPCGQQQPAGRAGC